MVYLAALVNPFLPCTSFSVQSFDSAKTLRLDVSCFSASLFLPCWKFARFSRRELWSSSRSSLCRHGYRSKDILRGYLHSMWAGIVRRSSAALLARGEIYQWRNPDAWRPMKLFTHADRVRPDLLVVLLLLPGRGRRFAAALYSPVCRWSMSLYEALRFRFHPHHLRSSDRDHFHPGLPVAELAGCGVDVLAWVFYVVSLTSKEVTVVIPVT